MSNPILIPYGKGHIECTIPHDGLLTSRIDTLKSERPGIEIVEEAVRNPIGSKRLCELAEGKKTCTIIISDHTRPVPSRDILPPMLAELRKGNPDIAVTLLVATGFHRPTTTAELEAKLGGEIANREKIVVHDAFDADSNVQIGVLPSGAPLVIDRVAVETDLLISEGFIEPHFFAGFSGGRKSVLPGIAARETVYWNHNADFIASPYARTGILEGNPLHRDMVYAARAAKLRFICNVVINAKHQVVGAFAGDCEQAHVAGTEFLKELCLQEKAPADIVITSNNGYPLDQNIYQAVKGMTAGEATCRHGGVIIMSAACSDGHGGASFMGTMTQDLTPAQILGKIQATPKAATVPDQWESQILARILSRHHVVLISEADPELVRAMKMHPARDIPQALELAVTLLGHSGTLTVIPEGISTIVV